MKKKLFLFLPLLMMFFCFSCGGDDPEPTPNPTPTDTIPSNPNDTIIPGDTVTPGERVFSIENKEISIFVGEKIDLIIKDTQKDTYTFKSSYPSIAASVSNSKTIEGKEAGIAVITVTTSDKKYSDTCTVIVKLKATGEELFAEPIMTLGMHRGQVEERETRDKTKSGEVSGMPADAYRGELQGMEVQYIFYEQRLNSVHILIEDVRPYKDALFAHFNAKYEYKKKDPVLIYQEGHLWRVKNTKQAVGTAEPGIAGDYPNSLNITYFISEQANEMEQNRFGDDFWK